MRYNAKKVVWEETETTGITTANTTECWPNFNFPEEVFRFDLNGKTVIFKQDGGDIIVEGVDPFKLTTAEFEKVKEEIALFKMK